MGLVKHYLKCSVFCVNVSEDYIPSCEDNPHLCHEISYTRNTSKKKRKKVVNNEVESNLSELRIDQAFAVGTLSRGSVFYSEHFILIPQQQYGLSFLNYHAPLPTRQCSQGHHLQRVMVLLPPRLPMLPFALTLETCQSSNYTKVTLMES